MERRNTDPTTTDTRPRTAGPYGFTRTEVISLVIVAVVLAGISGWTWWRDHALATGHYWTVEDVVVDSLLLARGEAEEIAAEPAAPAEIEDPGHVLIDVNTAAANDLVRLPGIGPVLANRIIASRGADGPFKSLEDLQRVPGIGPATAANLSGWVRFSRLTPAAADGAGGGQ